MYLTLQDIRDAGITSLMASDTLVNAAISQACQLIDLVTGQWFEARSGTLLVDGQDSELLQLPVPIISLTSMFLEGSTLAVDPNYYRVYNGRGPTTAGLITQMAADDRKNPKIILRRQTSGDIFTQPMSYGAATFFRGSQNVQLLGVFGYVEPDGTTPALIHRAAMLIAIDYLANPPFGTSSVSVASIASGPVVEEETDGHRIKYASISYSNVKSGGIALIRNAEAREILRHYRTPIGIATPSAWTLGTTFPMRT